jgi:Fur family ferric uptake transcriptional regulator
MTNEATPDTLLRNHGLKPSASRLLVLQALMQSAVRHLDAEAVYQCLVEQGAPLGLTTVYKVLAQFEQVGLVERRELRPGRRLYELACANHTEHGHLVCLQTRQVFEFDMAPLLDTLAVVAGHHGLALSRVVVTAYGVPQNGIPRHPNDNTSR